MKKSFWLSFPITAIAIILSFILRSILAKDFAKDELGFYYAAIDAIMFAVLPFLGFRSTMIVYFAKGDSFALNSLRQRYAMMATFIPSFILSIILSNILGAKVLHIVTLFVLFGIIVEIYISNQLSMIRAYSALNVVRFIEPIAPLVIYLIFKPNNADSLLVISSIAFLIPALYGAFYIWRQGYSEPKFEALQFRDSKSFYSDSMFAALEFGFGMAILFAASFIAAHNIGALSDFQVVIKPIILFALMLFVFPILRFIAPEIARTINDKTSTAYNDLRIFTLRYGIGVLILFALSMIWRKDIIIYIFSDKYLASLDALLFIPIASFFTILNTFLLASIKALGGFAFSFLVRVCGFVIFIIGYFWIDSLEWLVFWLAFSNFVMWCISWFVLKLRFNMSKLALI